MKITLKKDTMELKKLRPKVIRNLNVNCVTKLTPIKEVWTNMSGKSIKERQMKKRKILITMMKMNVMTMNVITMMNLMMKALQEEILYKLLNH